MIHMLPLLEFAGARYDMKLGAVIITYKILFSTIKDCEL